MLNTDNFTTFLPIFPFQILFKVQEKSESFEGFFDGKKFFAKPMLGTPNRSIRHIFEFFCSHLLAHIFLLQFQPISKGRKVQKYDEWPIGCPEPQITIVPDVYLRVFAR